MKTKQQIIVPANAPAESPEAAAGGSSGRAGSGSVPSSDGASKKKTNTLAWVFGGLGIAFAALGSIYFVKRSFCKRNTETLHELVRKFSSNIRKCEVSANFIHSEFRWACRL